MRGFFKKLALLAVPAIIFTSVSYTEVYANDAATIFQQLCALCHGADGKPTDAGKEFGSPDFTDAAWQSTKTDDQLIKSMTDGTDNPNYTPVGTFVKDMLDIDVDVSIFVPVVRGFAK